MIHDWGHKFGTSIIKLNMMCSLSGLFLEETWKISIINKWPYPRIIDVRSLQYLLLSKNAIYTWKKIMISNFLVLWDNGKNVSATIVLRIKWNLAKTVYFLHNLTIPSNFVCVCRVWCEVLMHFTGFESRIQMYHLGFCFSSEKYVLKIRHWDWSSRSEDFWIFWVPRGSEDWSSDEILQTEGLRDHWIFLRLNRQRRDLLIIFLSTVHQIFVSMLKIY